MLLRFATPVAALGAAPTVEWTPTQIIADLPVWFEAEEAANFSLSGATVTQWNDISGNARHLTSESGKQPTRETVADFGGLNAVKYDGSDDYLKTGAWNDGQPHTVIAIYRTGTSIDDLEQLVDANGGGSNRLAMSFKWSGASNKPHAFAGGATARTDTVLSTSTTYIDITELNGSSSKCWINGATPAPATFNPGAGAIGNSPADGIAVGGPSFASGLASFGGHIAEFIVCNRALTSTEREKMEGYLAHKWSRTGNLDGGHPYKSSPPTV